MFRIDWLCAETREPSDIPSDILRRLSSRTSIMTPDTASTSICRERSSESEESMGQANAIRIPIRCRGATWGWRWWRLAAGCWQNLTENQNYNSIWLSKINRVTQKSPHHVFYRPTGSNPLSEESRGYIRQSAFPCEVIEYIRTAVVSRHR